MKMRKSLMKQNKIIEIISDVASESRPAQGVVSKFM